MNEIEQSIKDDLSKQLAQEIDNEILVGLFEGMGWHKVTMPMITYDVNPITIWATETCRGKWKQIGIYYLFEDPADVTLYYLRWA